MKPITALIFTLIAISSAAWADKHETWTSSAGSQIEGVYIGSTESWNL